MKVMPLRAGVVYRLGRVMRTIMRSAMREYPESIGMGTVDSSVLNSIGDRGEITTGEIAEDLEIDKAQVSRSVKSLIKRGLVKTEKDRHNHKRKILTMTRQGHEVFGKVLEIRAARQKQLLTGISADRQRVLYEILDQINANAAAMIERPAAADADKARPARRRAGRSAG